MKDLLNPDINFLDTITVWYQYQNFLQKCTTKHINFVAQYCCLALLLSTVAQSSCLALMLSSVAKCCCLAFFLSAVTQYCCLGLLLSTIAQNCCLAVLLCTVVQCFCLLLLISVMAKHQGVPTLFSKFQTLKIYISHHKFLLFWSKAFWERKNH